MTTETSNAREWRNGEAAPECPTITDDEPVRLLWRDDEGRRCTTWASANEIGRWKHAAPPPAAARGDVRGLVAVPPQAEPVTDPSFSGGVMRKGGWAIPGGQGCVRVVDERMAYGWNQCREEMLQALAAEGVQAGEVEQRARELLAAEYDRCGLSNEATSIRSNNHPFFPLQTAGFRTHDIDAAIRAIASALSQQPEARGVVDGWTLASDSQPEPGAKINFAAIVSYGFLGSGDYPYVDALTGRRHMAKNVLAWRPALTGERNG